MEKVSISKHVDKILWLRHTQYGIVVQIINLWIRIIERNIYIKKLAFQPNTVYVESEKGVSQLICIIVFYLLGYKS